MATDRDAGQAAEPAGGAPPSELYGEWYFRHCCGAPYERSDHWLTFFGRIADWIAREVRPASVLDAGCAMGFLVEALRDRGIEAYGVDISPYAIENVREDIAPYCWVGSLVNPLPRRYDLIVCIEVLEHLPETEGRKAIEQLCRTSDDILMSSTPYDTTERTHFNVQPPEYWSSIFAEFGLVHDPEFDASPITPWAMRFHRRNESVPSVIVPFERKLWSLAGEVSSLRGTVESLQLALDSAEGQRNALRNRLATVESERDRLSLRGQDLERQVGAAHSELSRARESLAAASRTAQIAQEQLTLAQRRLSYRLLVRVWEAQMRLAPPSSRQGRAWLAFTRMARRVARAPLLAQPLPSSPVAQREAYEAWVDMCAAFRFNRVAARRSIEGFRKRPLVSILMPVYNPPERLLRDAIESVLAQYYENWQLCICDDASSDPRVRAVLDEYAELDSRIDVRFSGTNSGISGASNGALALSRGEYVGLLDHDDELTPDALFEVVSTLQESDPDLIYSDEDKRDAEGRLHAPFFKPDWSPDLLLSTMYTSHFSVYRKSIVDELGGFRIGYEGSQDYDLALRCSERAGSIAHIPRVLYHWRVAPGSAAASTEAKPYAYSAAERALTDALQRRGIAGTCLMTEAPGFYRIKRDIVEPGLVSIIIPTRDRVELLRSCISSIESLTDYPSYEILIMDNGSTDPETIEYLSASSHRVIRDDGPFNYSRLNNVAAEAAHGEYLLFLNNDTEVLVPEWMSAMVEHAQRPQVGAVGAKLLYPDGRIQHGGVVLGLGGPAAHAFTSVDPYDPRLFNVPNIIRNTSAVTAACLMVRASVFEEIGGFDEKALPVSYNDIDFCLRLRRRGYLVTYTPYAAVRHYESVSRGPFPGWQEATYMVGAYRREIERDPYYSPNLTVTRADYSLDLTHVDSLECVAYQPLFMDVTEPVAVCGSIGQELIADLDGLCAVGLKLSTGGRSIDGVLRLHVREAVDSPHDLAVAQDEATRVLDGEYHTLYFEPIARSRDRTLYIEIEHLGEGVGNLSVWASQLPQPALGRLFVGGQHREGALTFRAFARSTGGMSDVVHLDGPASGT